MLKGTFVCSLLVFFVLLGIQTAVGGGTGLPKAPGWEFGADIRYFKEAKVKYDSSNWDQGVENQKIINSWGYKARNVDEIKDLLPETFYNMLKHPEIWGDVRINETEFIPNKGVACKAYEEATRKYKGTCKLDEKGWLHNYKAGCPFPDLDPEKDPLGALKLAWNFIKRFQFDDRNCANIESIIDRQGNIRNLYADNINMHFNNRLMNDPKPLYQPNRTGLDLVYALPFMGPYSMRGTIPLIYRYDDPNKDDDMWMYLPAMRRVRRMSTTQTQDRLPGGMDFTWDTTENFYGKVNKFNWEYLGRRKMLLPIVSGNEPQVDTTGYFTGVDQYHQMREVYTLRATYKNPISMKSILMWVDTETWDTLYSVDQDIKGRDWLFQYYCHGRLKDGTFTTNNQTCMDIQRRHSSRSILPNEYANEDMKPAALTIQALKKKYLVR